MTHDIAGGLTINRLEIGAASNVRTLSGTQALIFSGDRPSIFYAHRAGAAGSHSIGVPIQLQQTVTLNGQVDFSRQFVFNDSSTLSGTGGLIIESGLFATNSNTNNFTGPVVIRRGLWASNTNNGFGQSSRVTVEPGGSIQLFGNSSLTVNRPLTLAGVGTPTVGGYALAAFGAGVKNWSGAITLGGNARVTAFANSGLHLSGSVALEGFELRVGASPGGGVGISGVISGTGGLVYSPAGSAERLSLTGTQPNSFVGVVTANVGTIIIRGDAQLGAAGNRVRLTNGATLATAGLNPFPGVVELPVTRLIELENGGRLTVNVNSQDEMRIRGVISGSGPLRIGRSGSGIKTFADNTFVGNIEIEELGALHIQSDSALGPVTNTVSMLGSTPGSSSLVIEGPGMTLAAGRTVSVDAGRKGNIRAFGVHTVASTLVGDGRIAVSGSGTLFLTGDNSVRELEVLQSTIALAVGKDAALGAPDGKLILSGATLRATDSFAISPDRTLISQATNTFNQIDTGNHVLVFNGDIAPDPVSGGDGGSILKVGTGTLVFNGVSSVRQSINIVDGFLLGDGSIHLLQLLDTAKLSAGQVGSAGLFTVVEHLTLGSSTTLLFEIGGTERGVSYDGIDIGEQLRSGGVVEVTLLPGFVPTAGSSFDLINFGNVFGEFDQLRLPGLPRGLEWDSSAFASTGVISVIPEPTALGLLAAPMVLLRRRR